MSFSPGESFRPNSIGMTSKLLHWATQFQTILLVFLITSIFQVYAASPPHSKQDGLTEALENPGSIDKPNWFKNSFLDISEDIEEAMDSDKLLLVYFYQDGCPYCSKLIQDNFGNTDIVKLTQKYFDVIAINMWGDREVIAVNGQTMSEKSFSQSYRVQFTPSFLVLNAKGEKLFRMNGYFHPGKFKAALNYVNKILKPSISKNLPKLMSFREYFAKQSQEKAKGVIHQVPGGMQAPHNFSLPVRDKGKPLLVLYEQKQCLVCDELHLDILKREQFKPILEKFEIAVLDMWSNQKLINTQGQKSTMKKWAEQLSVQSGPSFIFFDENNKEVFRTDGYMKAFHTQGILEYVLSKGYISQPNFQRWLGAKADALEAKGIHVDLWK